MVKYCDYFLNNSYGMSFSSILLFEGDRAGTDDKKTTAQK